jgi:hypothetical protein
MRCGCERSQIAYAQRLADFVGDPQAELESALATLQDLEAAQAEIIARQREYARAHT